MPNILLINPPVTDVAAYDLWAKPLGLLLWAARLRQWGCRVAMVDATDRGHPLVDGLGGRSRRDGRGHYYHEPWPYQPEPARIAQRRFKCYGLSPDLLRRAVAEVAEVFEGKVDMVVLATRMTYWYHGAQLAAQVVRESLGCDVPLVAGGIYASLLPDHARSRLRPDSLLAGPALETFPRWLRENLGLQTAKGLSADIKTWPQPAYDLLHDKRALPVLTSIGCPGHCSYCAARRLWGKGFYRLEPEAATDRIEALHTQFQTRNFAFYDDALLARPEKWFDPFLKEILRRDLDVRFHLPNGIHYTPVNAERAEMMRRAGFRTVRLSLESANANRLAEYRRGGSNDKFKAAVAALRSAGYKRAQIGAYILAGTPAQTAREVSDTMDFVHACGAHVRLCEYSPIPGTADWAKALEASGGALENEPLWQNNSLYYHRPEAPIGPAEIEALKEKVKQGRQLD
jgi:hypothetical protein